MPLLSLHYRFSQRFRVGAQAAFAWCTDYSSDDGALFSERTRRSVRWLAPDTALLTDLTWPKGRPLRIDRLVRLDPPSRSWTSTHLTGPRVHSQFWYRIVPEGRRRSRLEFAGLHLEHHPRTCSPAEVACRATERGRIDADEWRQFLAPAMERDLVGPRRIERRTGAGVRSRGRARRRARPGSRSGGASPRTS